MKKILHLPPQFVMICLLLFIFSPNNSIDRVSASTSDTDVIDLTILHINDLHGWLNPHDGIGGVAAYMGYFRDEGFDPTVENSSILLVSGGDQNTGPSTATLSKGEAVIEVMNLIGFDAAAIGNHEFDYGIDVMEQQQENASFPILSCNIYDVDTTNLPSFTIPWVVQNHSGVQVGFVGLTTQSTYTSAHPKYTQYYDFGDYEVALRKYVPLVKAAGADIIIALTHCTPSELQSLAPDISDLGITLFLGGHGGGSATVTVGDSLVVAAQHYAQQYAKIQLTYNTTSQVVTSKNATLVNNAESGITPDAEVQALVDIWDAKINVTEVITHSSSEINDGYTGSGIGNLVTDGFIHHYNYSYSFGIANRGGGFRDNFRAGDITIADVVSVIPFENNLYNFTIAGSELKELVEQSYGSLVFSGIKYTYTNDPFTIQTMQVQEDNIYSPIDLNKFYHGLIIDYVWYTSFQSDFDASETGVHYRDAVVEYFRTLEDLADHAYAEKYTIYDPDDTSTTSTTSITTTTTSITTTTTSTTTTTTDVISSSTTTTYTTSTTSLTTPVFQFFIILGMMVLVITSKKRFLR